MNSKINSKINSKTNSNIDEIIKIFKELPFEDKIIAQKEISQIIDYKIGEKDSTDHNQLYGKVYEDLHCLAWF